MKILKEPMLHFLIIGGAIFGLFNLSGESEVPGAASKIVLTSTDIERLAAAWEQRWERAPTKKELDGLIEEQIREEIYYREALALGLDRDDVAVRRVLRNKLEFVTQDIMASVEPDLTELLTYYDARPDHYREPTVVSFSQIYFASGRRNGDAGSGAELVLAQLGNGLDEAEALAAGDAQMFNDTFRDQSVRDIEAIFGPDFAAALVRLPPGIWSGPVASAYGQHLVRVDARSEGRRLLFIEVADKVRIDWEYELRQTANARMYESMRARYKVTVEPNSSAQGEIGGEG